MPRLSLLLIACAALLLGGCADRQAAQVDLQIIYDEVGGYISPQNLQRIQQAAVDAGNQLGAPVEITRGHPIVLPPAGASIISLAPQPGLPGISWPAPPLVPLTAPVSGGTSSPASTPNASK